MVRSYIEMKKEIRKRPKNHFKNIFFKLINNSLFGKAMENVRAHRGIKLVTTGKRRNYLVSEPNCHSTKFFQREFSGNKMTKTELFMNKYVSLGLSIL